MSDLIAFKLKDEDSAKLQLKAQQYDAPSVHRFAKRIVLDYLKDGERQRLREQVACLHEMIVGMRKEFAAIVRLLLLKGDKPMTPEEIQQWIAKHLLP